MKEFMSFMQICADSFNAWNATISLKMSIGDRFYCYKFPTLMENTLQRHLDFVNNKALFNRLLMEIFSNSEWRIGMLSEQQL